MHGEHPKGGGRMNGLQTFANEEFGAVRSLMIEDMPWFVGRDVATALGYAKPQNAIKSHVDADDALNQGIIDSMGRSQPTMLINESGLYSLILSSKLPPPSVSSAGSRPKCCQPSAGREGMERLHKRRGRRQRRRKRFRHGRLRTTITSAPRPSSPPAKTSACPMCWRT